MPTPRLYHCLLVLLFACTHRQPLPATTATENITHTALILQRVARLDSITFDYTLHPIKEEKGHLRANCYLHNLYNDTVYFISSTCNGMLYQIAYDSLLLEPITRISCNASYTTVEAIAPHDSLYIQADFTIKQPFTQTRLGFHLPRISNRFPVRDIAYNELAAFKQLCKDMMVWGRFVQPGNAVNRGNAFYFH